MNAEKWGASGLYQAMCKSVDGYVVICDCQKNGYEVTLPTDFIEEFNMPQGYNTQYFDVWKMKIHPEDQERYISSLKWVFENKTQQFALQYRAMNRNEEWVWLESRAYLSYDEEQNPDMFAGVIRNLGRQNQLDHITGLLNKYAFRETVKQKSKDGSPFDVLLLNIDDFHHINELHDQTFGDNVLRTLGTYIQSRVNGNASVYRLDGDEFGVLIMNPQENEAEQLYERVSHHYQTQKELQGKRYYCTFSATYHEYEEGTSYEDFIKALKVGINVVKRQGKNRLIKFNSEFLRYKERELELIE